MSVDMRFCVGVHRHNARHWIYPTEVPERAYQLAMIKTALLHNTLVWTTHRIIQLIMSPNQTQCLS